MRMLVLTVRTAEKWALIMRKPPIAITYPIDTLKALRDSRSRLVETQDARLTQALDILIEYIFQQTLLMEFEEDGQTSALNTHKSRYGQGQAEQLHAAEPEVALSDPRTT